MAKNFVVELAPARLENRYLNPPEVHSLYHCYVGACDGLLTEVLLQFLSSVKVSENPSQKLSEVASELAKKAMGFERESGKPFVVGCWKGKEVRRSKQKRRSVRGVIAIGVNINGRVELVYGTWPEFTLLVR
jgi:hypothetical protein